MSGFGVGLRGFGHQQDTDRGLAASLAVAGLVGEGSHRCLVAMESSYGHPLILPADKRNPCFSLSASSDGQFIDVFYDVEFLETMPNDRQHMAFRMMVARFYNAEVKVTALGEKLDLDRKTIGSWVRRCEHATRKNSIGSCWIESETHPCHRPLRGPAPDRVA